MKFSFNQSRPVLPTVAYIISIVCFILTGEYAIALVPLFPLVFLITFLTNIAFKFNRSVSELPLFICSSLLILLSFILSSSLASWSVDQQIGILGCILSPLFAWSATGNRSLIPQITPSYAVVFLLLIYFLLIPVAGPNILYRLAVDALILSIFFLRYRLLKFIVVPISSYLLIWQGARGGLFAFFLSFLLIGFYSFRLGFRSFFDRLSGKFTFKVRTLIAIIIFFPSIFLLPNIVLFLSPRSFLLFYYFLDSQSVLDQSEGTVFRQDVYSYLHPVKLFSFDFFGSVDPPTTTYPHNFILDVYGNYGFLPFLVMALSVLWLIRSFAVNHQLTSSPYLVFSIPVLFASLVSGTIFDFYPLFSFLPFVLTSFASNRLHKSPENLDVRNDCQH